MVCLLSPRPAFATSTAPNLAFGAHPSHIRATVTRAGRLSSSCRLAAFWRLPSTMAPAFVPPAVRAAMAVAASAFHGTAVCSPQCGRSAAAASSPAALPRGRQTLARRVTPTASAAASPPPPEEGGDPLPASLPIPDAFPAAAAPSPSSPPARSDAPAPAAVRKQGMVTAVSAAPTLHAALADVASRVLASLGGGGCTAGDLAIVFVSSKYGEKMGRSGRQGLDSVVPKLRSFLPGLVHVIGTTADGVVGATEGGERHEEVQERPGVSLSLLRMGGGVRLTPFTVMIDDLPGLDASASRWQRLVGGGKPLSELEGGERPAGEDSFLIFADPYFHSSGHLSKLLQGLDFGFPSAPKVWTHGCRWGGGCVGWRLRASGESGGRTLVDWVQRTSGECADGAEVATARGHPGPVSDAHSLAAMTCGLLTCVLVYDCYLVCGRCCGGCSSPFLLLPFVLIPRYRLAACLQLALSVQAARSSAPSPVTS